MTIRGKDPHRVSGKEYVWAQVAGFYSHHPQDANGTFVQIKRNPATNDGNGASINVDHKVLVNDAPSKHRSKSAARGG